MSEWDTIGYIISSQHRTSVLDRLNESPATPTQIGEDTSLDVTHVSRTLTSLREEDLVELLVPEDRRKGRIYGPTSQGVEVWEDIQKEYHTTNDAEAGD